MLFENIPTQKERAQTAAELAAGQVQRARSSEKAISKDGKRCSSLSNSSGKIKTMLRFGTAVKSSAEVLKDSLSFQ